MRRSSPNVLSAAAGFVGTSLVLRAVTIAAGKFYQLKLPEANSGELQVSGDVSGISCCSSVFLALSTRSGSLTRP